MNIPNYLVHTEIVLFNPQLIDFWNNKEFHEYDDEQEDDPTFTTIMAYYYIMVGNVKPLPVPEYNFLQWKDSVQELREFLWRGIRKTPHKRYSDSYFLLNRATDEEVWANRLANLAQHECGTNKEIRKNLIVIPHNNFSPRAEVILRAINFIKHINFLYEEHNKTWDGKWLQSRLAELGIVD